MYNKKEADRKYYLFSKNGFTEELKKLAKGNDGEVVMNMEWGTF